MNIFKSMLILGAIALSATAAETYKVSLPEPTIVAGRELKPGDYRVEVDGGRAVIKDGKKTVAESPVKVETANEKFAATKVRYDNGGGKYNLQEIRIGGTSTKLVFAGEAAN